MSGEAPKIGVFACTCGGTLSSQPGIVWVGTNTELAKTSGNTGRNVAAWTASGFFTSRPMVAMIHENENEKIMAKASAPIRPAKLVW